ncbi:hypothetical protein L596_016471 [Steinernema carpocapsae]|uniref:Uncharacterized protein n=1 Tax=Steinernema carpocapsae TaxID=34508 RepID=A0A4U5NIZ6_STECR|nr:hypothetical protein L596_016471 [Steinernema carpocapsae]
MSSFSYVLISAPLELLSSTTCLLFAARIFWVIVSSRTYQKMGVYQIMAVIALLECSQSIATFVGILMVFLKRSDDVVSSVAGTTLISAWIGLVYLRFMLGLNRFINLTEPKKWMFLTSSIFLKLSILIPVAIFFTVLSIQLIYIFWFDKPIFVFLIDTGIFVYTSNSGLIYFEK